MCDIIPKRRKLFKPSAASCSGHYLIADWVFAHFVVFQKTLNLAYRTIS